MTFPTTAEARLADAEATAAKHTILTCVVGSHLYGTNVASSDRDEMSIAVGEPRHLIGYGSFDHYVSRPGGPNDPSRPGDVERTTYSLRKYVSLAAGGNPNVLPVLFAPDEFVTVTHPVADELRRMRSRFVTARTLGAYLGFASQERERFRGERGQKNVNRRELVDRFGYDVKYAANIVRVAAQGCSLASDGELVLPLPEPTRSQVIAIRSGEVPLDEANRMVDSSIAALERACHAPARRLPEFPDWDVLGGWVVDAHLAYWKDMGMI